MDTLQVYETLCLVVSAALGGKTESAGPAPQTMYELEAVLKKHLG